MIAKLFNHCFALIIWFLILIHYCLHGLQIGANGFANMCNRGPKRLLSVIIINYSMLELICRYSIYHPFLLNKQPNRYHTNFLHNIDKRLKIALFVCCYLI